MLINDLLFSLMVVFFLFSTGKAQDADPVLGSSAINLVRQSDMDRFIGYHPASEQKGFVRAPIVCSPSQENVGKPRRLPILQDRKNSTKTGGEGTARLY
jgi:hypothetical protein